MKFTCSNENKIQEVIEYLSKLNPYETYWVSIEKFNERYSNTIGLLTTVEASKRLKLSLTHVYYLIRTGELKPVKVQRSYYFKEEDLESFIHERESRKSNKVQS